MDCIHYLMVSSELDIKKFYKRIKYVTKKTDKSIKIGRNILIVDENKKECIYVAKISLVKYSDDEIKIYFEIVERITGKLKHIYYLMSQESEYKI